MKICVNGEFKEIQPPMTVAELLDSLNIEPGCVAVERNLEILPKEQYSKVQVAEGDELEVVRFVGGGAGKQEKSLVIVESPAKCKTIHKYLGPNFEVQASMGHLIDLPKSKMGIDIENNFEPQYIVVAKRRKTLSDLKNSAKGKDKIYLACDPDREGEAISWHLKNQLGTGKKVYRVVFNEITKEAVQDAFKRPGEIDMNLVGAQQARRVLDRLVGYSLSPLLWQKVGRGLSAGRVQSVALRLVVDQERKIRAFIPEEYWSIDAELKKPKDKKHFSASLEKLGAEKLEIKNETQANEHREKAASQAFVVQDVRRVSKKKNPTPPFTTSKLQQAAYNALHFPAAKTMRVAQGLYEGVELGPDGSVGLITYMRTDSVRVSQNAIEEVRALISRDFGKKYLPDSPNFYKAKKEAQEAHEAIRPSSVLRTPDAVQSYLSPDEWKLYTLIWNKFVASQMMPAEIEQNTVDIAAGPYLFKATGSRIEFPGYLAVYGRSEEEENPLPALEKGQKLELIDLKANQHFTKPPARFTDASLVKALEEMGIGRPSTYAPTIMTILARDYVHREGGSLVPTDLGMIVTDLLVQHFEKIVDFQFTANMEEELDRVEEGKRGWVSVVKDFYKLFESQVSQAQIQMQSVKREVEPTDEVCEKCGKPMVIKWGRRGKFMSCSGWPECKNAKSIPTNVPCPKCGQGKLVARRARSGRGRPFYGCSRYPECDFLANKLPREQDEGEKV